MNDDQLRSELERRADSATPWSDWPRRVLLPAVWHEIDARPHPVITARLSPKWGAVTVVVALLVLVVAVPRVLQQTPSSTPTAVPGQSAPPSTAGVSSEPSAAPATIDCGYLSAGQPPEPVLATIIDHTGSVQACSLASRTDSVANYVEVSNPDGDARALDVTINANCPALVAMDFWAPPTSAYTVDRFGEGHVLQINRDTTAGTGGCADREQLSWTFTLTLDQPINASDVNEFVTNGPESTNTVETHGQRFALEMSAGFETYTADSAIDVSATTTYLGPGPASVANYGVSFGFQQLDGTLQVNPVHEGPCVTDIRNFNPNDAESWPYTKGAAFSDTDPNAGFYRQYLQDPDLHLPAGVYRLIALLSFVDGSCPGEQVSVDTSIVIRVAPGPTPAPASLPPLSSFATDRETAAGASFDLSISADKGEYAAGEAIDVSSTLSSESDVTVHCLWEPIISLEQLDGDLRFSPGPFIESCPGERELASAEQLTNGFLPAVWALLTPNPMDPYVRDGKLYLPPGTYQFTARSSLAVGESGSSGNGVRLEASVVIRVDEPGAPSPSPVPSPLPSPGAQTFDCGAPELAHLPITVADHAGLLGGCAAELVPGDRLQQPTLTISGSSLVLSFDGGDWCDLTEVRIDMWHPLAQDREVRPYALQVDYESGAQMDYPAACGSYASSNFVLTFPLNRYVDPSTIEPFVTRQIGDRPPSTSSSATRGPNYFQLDLGTERSDYSPTDAIDPTATFTYSGNDNTIGLGAYPLVGPWAVEQLDGDLYLGNDASLLVGHLDCDQATNGQSQEFDYVKPAGPSTGPPDDPRLQALYDGKDLILPEGTWRITVYSNFNVGCPLDPNGILYDPVRMSASVVIHVGSGQPPSPPPPPRPSAPAGSLDCGTPGLSTLIVNPGDLVTSCRALTADEIQQFDSDVAPGTIVEESGGDATRWRIRTAMSMCTQNVWLTLSESGDQAGFQVSASTPCILDPARVVAIEIVLSRPEQVTVVQWVPT